MLGQAAAVVGALLGVRLLTELMDPAAYGELALAMTVATLVNQVVFGPISGGVSRFFAPAREQNDLGSYLVAGRRLVLMASMAMLAIIGAMVLVLILLDLDGWIAVAISAMVFAILSGWSAVLSGVQAADRRRMMVALHQGLESWLRFLVAAWLLVWIGPGSSVAMAGYALALAFVVASQYGFFRGMVPKTSGSLASARSWQTKILEFSLPISIFGIFTWMQLVSDRWALGLFATKDEVGLYAVLFQLGYFPISMLSGAMGSFLAPIFYQRAGDASDGRRMAMVNRFTWVVTWCLLVVTGIAVLFASLFHGFIFRLFVAPQYHAVSIFLPWVVLAGGVFAASQSLALALMSQLKTRLMIPVKIGTALLGILLNLSSAYFFGIAGIVFASVLFSFLIFSWMLVVFRSESLST